MTDPPEKVSESTLEEQEASDAISSGEGHDDGKRGGVAEACDITNAHAPRKNAYFDEDEGLGDDESECEGESDGRKIKALPQARIEAALGRQPSSGSEGDLVECKLTPVDLQSKKQSLQDALKGDAAPPPLARKANGGAHHVQFSEERSLHHRSTLHQDEYPQLHGHGGKQHHNPRNYESALATNDDPSNSNKFNPFKGRKKNRLVPGHGSRKGHSHPRKSPYKSEVARLRHAQQMEREKRKGSNDPHDDASSNASGLSVSIKDTTAPPDSAFFSIQSSKFKHSLLHSLGEFLTSAFADDEEASGSYFSQDLLDQLSNSNPYLKGVWLQAKNLNDTHVQQLCEALLRNKVVTEVWLPSNQITDVGAGYIAHMLKFNRSIKELFLGENEIGPKGAAALASALARGNTTLVALGLGNNHIGVEGAGAFAAALRHNHSLHTLDIKNNGIPKRSSIRGLLNKMLEFNASDPGDESLVLGLQEELANLVGGLPSEDAERVVLQAEEALKTAMLCRKRGDKIGAAEAEGIFIRICTTGEPPIDPPEEMVQPAQQQQQQIRRQPVKKKRRPKKRTEPDRLDGLSAELSSLKFGEGTHDSKQEETRASAGNCDGNEDSNDNDQGEESEEKEDSRNIEGELSLVTDTEALEDVQTDETNDSMVQADPAIAQAPPEEKS